VLPPAFAADADRLARFEREARTLASLNHPDIAIVRLSAKATIQNRPTTWNGVEFRTGPTSIDWQVLRGAQLRSGGLPLPRWRMRRVSPHLRPSRTVARWEQLEEARILAKRHHCREGGLCASGSSSSSYWNEYH
jgi:hypothetical protein